MINAEEKLERFSASLLGETWQSSEEMIKKAESESTERILHASDKYAALAKKTIKEQTKAIRLKYVKTVAAGKLEAQQAVLLHRRELTDSLFENVEKRLLGFAASEKYGDYLCGLVEKCIKESGERNVTVRLSARDFDRRNELFGRLADVQTVKDPTIRLGGLKCTFAGSNVMYDCSFDTALEAQREAFGGYGEMMSE